MFRKALDEEVGYSLAEVMVAILILAIAIIPMVGMFDAGLRASVTGSNYDKARSLANERLERVRALPYNRPLGAADSAVEIYAPGTPVTGTSGAFTYRVETAYWGESGGTLEANPSNTIVKPLMRIVVTVTWGGNNSYKTTGFTAAGAN